MTVGSVCAAATTSTSGSTGAGLKKCRPATRSGFAVAAAISVTDSDEVLVARIAVASHAASRVANRARLTSRSSTTASMTKAHGDRSATELTAVRRLIVPSASSLVSRPSQPSG